MQEDTKLTAQEARALIDTFFRAAIDALRAGESVRIDGFGTFRKVYRKGRTARNPHTGQPVEVPAHSGIKFTPCRALKNL